MKNWQLAYGSKVKCYLNPGSVSGLGEDKKESDHPGGGAVGEKEEIDGSALMMAAMSDPDIMAVMMNPKALPIAAKIKANPEILLGGAKAFSSEFKADPELGILFKSIEKNVIKIIDQARGGS